MSIFFKPDRMKRDGKKLLIAKEDEPEEKWKEITNLRSVTSNESPDEDSVTDAGEEFHDPMDLLMFVETPDNIMVKEDWLPSVPLLAYWKKAKKNTIHQVEALMSFGLSRSNYMISEISWVDTEESQGIKIIGDNVEMNRENNRKITKFATIRTLMWKDEVRSSFYTPVYDGFYPFVTLNTNTNRVHLVNTILHNSDWPGGYNSSMMDSHFLDEDNELDQKIANEVVSHLMTEQCKAFNHSPLKIAGMMENTFGLNEGTVSREDSFTEEHLKERIKEKNEKFKNGEKKISFDDFGKVIFELPEITGNRPGQKMYLLYKGAIFDNEFYKKFVEIANKHGKGLSTDFS